ncbi:MAG: hypothetical protein IJS09_03185 [Treponema sp.]|nr:hypothetical protein [Treponema sp.]
MQVELRKNTRFEEFGRIDCEALGPVSGVLDDISVSGCRVHFDIPVTVNLENDYELHVRLSRFPSEELVLITHPEWTQETENSTKIGFSILRSPDTSRLEEYVTLLHAEKKEIDSDGIPQEEDKCLFV